MQTCDEAEGEKEWFVFGQFWVIFTRNSFRSLYSRCICSCWSKEVVVLPMIFDNNGENVSKLWVHDERTKPSCENRATRSSASRQGFRAVSIGSLGAPTSATSFPSFPLDFERFGYTFTVNFLLNSSLSSWLILLYPNSTRLQRYPIHWAPIWAIYHLLWYVRDL